MTTSTTAATAAILAALIAIPASAQNLDSMSGYVGLTGGMGVVRESDETSPDTDEPAFVILDGSIEFDLGQSYWVGIDVRYRYDDFAGDFDDGEDPQSEYTVGLHVLRNFGETTRAGVLLAYGDTRPQDNDVDDAYDVFLIGVEAQSHLADNVMVYTQVGFGDKIRDVDDQEGFDNGIFARFGMQYAYSENTTFTADFEVAGNETYVDNNDPGRFFGVTLSGKTRLPTDMPLYANYFARYDHYDSTDESEAIDEYQFGVGVQYAFGGGSTSIGSPRLPTRASAWTEWMD